MRLRPLLLLVALLELATLVGLGLLAGGLVVLGVVLGTLVVGANLLRAPGYRLTGVLLMVPGLLSDLLGLVFLLPAPRRWAGRMLQALCLRGMPSGGFQRVVFTTTMPPTGAWPPAGEPPPSGSRVVEAEVVDVRVRPPGELPAD